MDYDFNSGDRLSSSLHGASNHEDPTVSPSRCTWLTGCSTKPPRQISGCRSIPREPGNQDSSTKPRFSHRTFQKSGLSPHLDSRLRFPQCLTRPAKRSPSLGHSTGRERVTGFLIEVLLRPILNSSLDPLQRYRLPSAAFGSRVTLA
jgi:hypothetical protein